MSVFFFFSIRFFRQLNFQTDNYTQIESHFAAACSNPQVQFEKRAVFVLVVCISPIWDLLLLFFTSKPSIIKKHINAKIVLSTTHQNQSGIFFFFRSAITHRTVCVIWSQCRSFVCLLACCFFFVFIFICSIVDDVVKSLCWLWIINLSKFNLRLSTHTFGLHLDLNGKTFHFFGLRSQKILLKRRH